VDLSNQIILGLAIWGAVTGTIGLLIRLLDWRSNRSKLSVSVRHDAPSGRDLGTYADIVNLSRRSVSLRTIDVSFNRPDGSSRRPDVWVFSVPKDDCELSEGQTYSLRLDEHLAKAAFMPSIVLTVGVHDSRGGRWISSKDVGERADRKSIFRMGPVCLCFSEFRSNQGVVTLRLGYYPSKGLRSLISPTIYSVRQDSEGTCPFQVHSRLRWVAFRAYRTRFRSLLQEQMREDLEGAEFG
jgi:hypothetical protein